MSTKNKRHGHLIEFRTNVSKKEYTRCDRGIIVGSDTCKGCPFFISKVVYNNKVDKNFEVIGLVECDYASR